MEYEFFVVLELLKLSKALGFFEAFSKFDELCNFYDTFGALKAP